MLYRFVVGVGPVSNMTDGFTWGIWEPMNVVVFTGIGAGAFSVGLLTYALNKGQYHGLVRPAVLVGAIAYTLGGELDRGRARPLLERVLAAVDPVLEPLLGAPRGRGLRDGVRRRAVGRGACPRCSRARPRAGTRAGRASARSGAPRLTRALPFIIALAIVLPTMHQSSLGGLMLIAETKVHPLWHTALLPTLFLVSCLSMGFGAVVALVTILKLTWNGSTTRGCSPSSPR